MKRICLISITMLALLFATSCNNNVAEKPQVKNVIYLIGDGMGFGAVSSLLLSEDSVTGFEQAPVRQWTRQMGQHFGSDQMTTSPFRR